MKKEFASFFGTWGEYFYHFMVGLGWQIVMAALYISMGIAFLAVGLQLPPEVVSEAVGRHGGMTLFMLVVIVATAVQIGKFVVWLIEKNKEAQSKKPAVPQKEAA